MKKRNLLLMFIALLFVLITPVKATNTISLVCNQTTTNTTTCKIKLNIDEIDDITPIDIYFSTNDLDVNINAVGNSSTNCGSSKCSITSIQSGENIVATLNITNPTDKDVKPTIQIDSTYGKDSKTFTLKASKKSVTTTTTTTKVKSDNNYLSSITIDGEEIENFSKSTTKYFVDVENDIKKVTIKAKAEDDTATVSIDGPKSLNVGDNEYTISVTSESDSTKYYKVIITRADEEESSSTEIKNIKIKGYKLNFDKASKTFHLNIKPEDTELDITVKLKDKKASYEIEDNDNLKDGSVIKIIVTAEDGTNDTYRIIISKKSSNVIPIVIGLLILLAVIVIIVLTIINKKRKNNKNNNKAKQKDIVKEKQEKENIKDEKTIEMPAINKSEQTHNINFDDEDYNIPYDNDEEEETRILSYAEEKELEKANKEEDEKTSMELDKALDNMLSFEYESDEDDE